MHHVKSAPWVVLIALNDGVRVHGFTCAKVRYEREPIKKATRKGMPTGWDQAANAWDTNEPTWTLRSVLTQLLLTQKPKLMFGLSIRFVIARRDTFLYVYAAPLLKTTTAVPLSTDTYTHWQASEVRDWMRNICKWLKWISWVLNTQCSTAWLEQAVPRWRVSAAMIY